MVVAGAAYAAGDAVRTSYGAGVIVAAAAAADDDDRNNDGGSEFFSVRLWRHPGRSVGSAALARLGLSAVRCVFRQKLSPLSHFFSPLVWTCQFCILFVHTVFAFL